ncbi:MAG: ribonuclease PH [Oligoflexia bacterium]|nr:ribonuclease PH [Oligoflexia bacterium]
MRADGRTRDVTRDLRIDPFFLDKISHSVKVSMGSTVMVCCATLEKGVPNWIKGQGRGWVTAEYGMLPRSSNERIKRERSSLSGRTQEIQRLIGRSLRACVDLRKLGERQIIVDCDVIQADGGTRTLGITGGFVALSLLVNDMLLRRELYENPIMENVAAVSVGIVDGEYCVDLNYEEDSSAGVDMNVVLTSSLSLVEVQGTAEGQTFSRDELVKLLGFAENAVPQIFDCQNEAVSAWVDARRKEYGSF